MPAPTAADLIFSSDQANHNFSKTLGELKRSTLSIHNRLQSVLSDAEFAQSVAEAYGRPLIANERCGSWYIDPKNKEGSAYFKSTDGHNGVWQFSSRRLNFQLLEIAGKKDGWVDWNWLWGLDSMLRGSRRCIIVDSTRRGKSKTPLSIMGDFLLTRQRHAGCTQQNHPHLVQRAEPLPLPNRTSIPRPLHPSTSCLSIWTRANIHAPPILRQGPQRPAYPTRKY